MRYKFDRFFLFLINEICLSNSIYLLYLFVSVVNFSLSKNFLSIFKAENVRKSLENILSRFTLSMLLSIVITFLSIYIIYLETESISKETTELARINISLFLTFFISV